MTADIFDRTRLLVGEAAMSRLGAARVIVFGVGGVGSWCAESLVRSGIGHLTIVDADMVNITNVNRQLMATTATVGREKVEVMRERLLQINPAAHITAIHQLYNADSADQFLLDEYDYVVDAIDSLKDKALLILRATSSRARLFSSMGAALKMDPSHIRVAEFWKVEGDPLARCLRRKFKSQGLFPERKFLCVYSDEQLQNQGEPPVEEGPELYHKVQVNGTIVHITAIFGLTLASLVIRDVVG